MPSLSAKDSQKIGRLENMASDWKANGVSTDSRQVQAGNLFFAIRGATFDGHAFVKDAVIKGAAACVVSEEWFAKNKHQEAGGKFIVAGDPLKALQMMAGNHRQKHETSVIAVTGTNGKTTCKEMTHAVLQKSFETIATQGNLNNEIGVPLTLLRIEDTTQVAIIEMGADKKGDIAFLCGMAKPDSGVITNVGTAHLQTFGHIENVAATKSELFESLAADGVRFVNVDDAYLQPHAKQTKGLISFGIHNPADYHGTILSVNEDACAKIEITSPEKISFTIQLPVPGIHNAYHALAASAMGMALGVEHEAIVDALEHYQPLKNRIGIKQFQGFTILDDTYNSNPDSARAALDTLAMMKHASRRIAVLSDMLELGRVSAEEHFKIGEYAAAKELDALFVTGEESKKIFEGAKFLAHAYYFEKKKALIDALRNFIKSGDTILIKGSRSTMMEEVVQHLLM
jgi:UDP-N-acetylmuramoyl-tripeptide--D-alanyl-D-alanine ligase